MWGVLLFGLLIGPQGGRGGVRAVPPGEPALARIGPAQTPDLKVVIGGAVYQPDGGMSIEATTLSNTAPNVAHIYSRRSLCDTATSGVAEPADATFGWRLTVNTVRVTPTDLVVSVDWRRVWDRGKRPAGPSGTVQLTLHPGDRIPLDLIPNPAPTDLCRAVGIGLEVSVARTTATGSVNTELLPLGAVEGGVTMLDADLWLLHTQPAGTQHAEHQTVRLPASGATFSFSPVKLATPQGEVLVEITGSFRRYRSPTGAEFLQVSMARKVSGGPAPPGGFAGGTGTVIALPGPGDVTSLEMPSARGAVTGGARGGRGGAGGGGGGGRAMGVGGQMSGPPNPTGGGAAAGSGGQAGTGGTVAARTSGGQGTERAMVPSAGATAAQLATILDGHAFSMRFKVTPVPGS